MPTNITLLKTHIPPWELQPPTPLHFSIRLSIKQEKEKQILIFRRKAVQVSDVHLQLRSEQQVDAPHENPSSDGQRYIQGITYIWRRDDMYNESCYSSVGSARCRSASRRRLRSTWESASSEARNPVCLLHTGPLVITDDHDDHDHDAGDGDPDSGGGHDDYGDDDEEEDDDGGRWYICCCTPHDPQWYILAKNRNIKI